VGGAGRWQVLRCAVVRNRGRYSHRGQRPAQRPENTEGLSPLVSHEAAIGEKFCKERERETGLEPATPCLGGTTPFRGVKIMPLV
jgi:hypothetical protein